MMHWLALPHVHTASAVAMQFMYCMCICMCKCTVVTVLNSYKYVSRNIHTYIHTYK